MKKLLTIAALVGATSLSFGQGFVQFLNSSGTRFSTNAPASAPGTGFLTVAAGTTIGQFYFALFAAPSTQNTISSTSDPTLNGWTYVAIATNTTGGGRLDGNNSDAASAVNVPGFAGGVTADFAIAGWSSSIGTSWAQAQAWWSDGSHTGSQTSQGYFGINTSVGDNISLATAGGPYNPIFGTAAGFLHGWGMSYYVPEPSTFALAGAGAAAMLIFRRRKA